MSSTIYIVVVRYLIMLAVGALLHRGIIAAAPGDDVVDAVAQIVTAVLIAVGLTLWATLRSTKAALLSRVAAMRDVSTIHADPPLAAAMQARGVTNVVATPPGFL